MTVGRRGPPIARDPASPPATPKLLAGGVGERQPLVDLFCPAQSRPQGLPEIRFLKSPCSGHTHASTLAEASGFLPPIFASLRH